MGIFGFDAGDLALVFLAQHVILMDDYLHLVPVVQKIANVILHEDPDLLLGGFIARHDRFQILDEKFKTLLLDFEEDSLLILEIIIRRGKADTHCSRDFPHGGLFITLEGKDLGAFRQNVFIGKFGRTNL